MEMPLVAAMANLPAGWKVEDWQFVDMGDVNEIIERAQTYLVEVNSVTHCPGHPLLVDVVELERCALAAFSEQKAKEDRKPIKPDFNWMRQPVYERVTFPLEDETPKRPRKKIPKRRPRKKIPKRA